MSTETGVAASSQGTEQQDAAFRDFFPCLPEVATCIMKYHYSNHIRGVLLLCYTDYPEHPVLHISSHYPRASEVHYSEDEEHECCDQPVTIGIDMEKIQKVLKIRHGNKLFARCMLDAFFTSPIVIQHVSYDFRVPDKRTIKVIWFLPCQIKPKFVQRGARIRARYYTMAVEGDAFVWNKTDIRCVRTGMDLALSKQMHLSSITDVDASLFANNTNRIFIHNHNDLAVRGIQFSGNFENYWYFPDGWNARLIQTYWTMLRHSHWRTINLDLYQYFNLYLRSPGPGEQPWMAVAADRWSKYRQD